MSVIGALSRVGRVVFGATAATSTLALAMEWLLNIRGTPIFIVSGLGILGLAYVIGAATERLGALTSAQLGGILNATFGNIAELTIAFFALAAGQLEVVKASLTGSIIGNLLLVLGASLLLGGLRHGPQRFSAKTAGLDATLLVLAVIGLFIPAIFAISPAAGAGSEPRIHESEAVAAVLLVLYALNLVYRLRHPETVPGSAPEHEGGVAWSGRMALAVLVVAAAVLAVLSEQLVGAIDPFIASFALTPFFVGIIVIPTIGNLAEQLVAVRLALKDRIDFTMAVSIGASLQVALFVAPVLVLLGVLIGQPMDLVFTPLEIAAVTAAAGIAALVALDGESTWLEGALLLGVYVIAAVSFFFQA